jgi:hypothetical protein
MSPIYVPGKLTLRKEFVWNETVWNPSMISTALWLDAADASTITGTTNVISWLDKSGNGRNATATTGPSLISAGLGGKNFLRFDSNSEFLSINYAWPSTQTVFLVTASNVATIQAARLSAIYGQANPQGYPNNTNISTHNGFASTIQRRVAFETQSGATVNYRRINGSSTSSQNVSRFEFAIAGFAASSLVQSGKNVAIPSAYFPQTSSDLAEVIVASSILPVATAEKIEGYLAHKWGLTASLPSDHPYKLVGPTP